MEIYTPLKSDFVFRNLSPFKKLIKPIKVKNNLKFIDEIFERAHVLGSLLHNNVSLEQVRNHDELNINCQIKYDLGFEIWASLGSGYNFGVSYFDNDDKYGMEISSTEDFKTAIKGKTINQFINTMSLTLNQKVNNIETSFNYKVQ